MAAHASTGTVLGASDQLEIQVSEDCGISYTTAMTIDGSNHTTGTNLSSIEVPLAAFDGKDIKVRFVGSHGGGSAYFIDLDNINILACFLLDKGRHHTFICGMTDLLLPP